MLLLLTRHFAAAQRAQASSPGGVSAAPAGMSGSGCGLRHVGRVSARAARGAPYSFKPTYGVFGALRAQLGRPGYSEPKTLSSTK